MNQLAKGQNIRNNRFSAFLSSYIYKYQHTLIILIFVSATLIFLDLGLFSASFVFGLSLIMLTLSKTPKVLKPRGLMWFLFVFLIIALISLIFSELPLTFSHFKLYFQTIYWFLLAVIINNYYPFINKKKLSKYVLYSVLLLLVLYIAGLKVGTKNAIAFTVIILSPLGYYYIEKFWLKVGFASLLLFLILLNGSRTGAIISFAQFVFILMLSTPVIKKYFKSTLVVLLVLLLSANIEPARVFMGRLVSPINEDLGLLLENPEYVMMNDMSWLVREAQVQKGKQIFAEHPILGIGYNNFVEYDIEIDENQIESDRPLKSIDNRSSHNTYVSIIAETGILGFSVFILLFVSIFIQFWKYINIIGGTFESYVFVSFIGLLIYFYTISALLGTSSWIMYGLIAGAALKIKNRNK